MATTETHLDDQIAEALECEVSLLRYMRRQPRTRACSPRRLVPARTERSGKPALATRWPSGAISPAASGRVRGRKSRRPIQVGTENP